MSALDECRIHRGAVIIACRECAERNPNIRKHHDAYVASVRANYAEEDIPMNNAFADGNVASAGLNIDRAIESVERLMATDLPDPRLVGAAYAELLEAKGKLAAAQQLEEMQRTLEEARIEVARAALGVAETERPAHLRLVR